MFDAYADFGDIKGSALAKGFENHVMVTSYKHEVTQPATITQKAVGGRSAEAVQFSEFEISKLVDAATPKLFEAACKGTHIPKVVVAVVRSGGDPVKYLEIELKEVLISGIVHLGDPTGDNQFPTEIVKMTFGQIAYTYTKQGADGKAAGNVAAKWNVAQGAAA